MSIKIVSANQGSNLEVPKGLITKICELPSVPFAADGRVPAGTLLAFYRDIVVHTSAQYTNAPVMSLGLTLENTNKDDAKGFFLARQVIAAIPCLSSYLPNKGDQVRFDFTQQQLTNVTSHPLIGRVVDIKKDMVSNPIYHVLIDAFANFAI